MTVNAGGDEGWPITSDAGLMPVEQLIMLIATRDAQAIPPIPLMYEEFMTEDRGLLLTDASGAHLFQLRKFLRTSLLLRGTVRQRHPRNHRQPRYLPRALHPTRAHRRGVVLGPACDLLKIHPMHRRRRAVSRCTCGVVYFGQSSFRRVSQFRILSTL